MVTWLTHHFDVHNVFVILITLNALKLEANTYFLDYISELILLHLSI